MKVVINRRFGGYCLSDEALQYMGLTLEPNLYSLRDGRDLMTNMRTPFQNDRSNPLLVKCVEELGERANGRVAELHVVEIPDGVTFEITEYDGMEEIHEAYRVWI